VSPFLRRHETLPGEAIVVRGGEINSVIKLIEDALDFFAFLEHRGEEPCYGISVCSLPDCTAHEIARVAGTRHLPQTRMRVSTVGALTEAGYEVVPSGYTGHATLIFPGLPTDDDWTNLQHLFSAPEDNPVARKPRHA
jgi:hypothetical protein